MEKKSTKPTVLIIEDDQLLSKLMQKKIIDSGFNAVAALDGEEGLKKVAKLLPDLILLDLLLPGIDGFEVLRRLKRDTRFRDIVVIVISNLGETKNIEAAMQEGAAEYIIKAESSPEQILTMVRRFIDDVK